MARIILAWELGTNLGHINKLSSLANEFRVQGHEVVFVLKDLSRAQAFIGQQGFDMLQAPIWLPKSIGMPPVETYADILMRMGYLDAEGVIGLVSAWCNLFKLVKADLVVADHAPTALLSAHVGNIPSVTFGNSFALPPRTTPLPNLMWWLKADTNKLMQRETRVLNTINNVCEYFQRQPLKHLADLFDTEANFILSLPELDNYRQRTGGEYFGPPFNLDIGTGPAWPEKYDKKVFAYLYPGYKNFEVVLQALHSLPCSSIIYAPGVSQQLRAKYESAQLTFASQALNMGDVRKECDLGICHSGSGTGAAILLAGKPLLLLPTQQEQLLAALRVEELGAAITIKNENTKTNYKKHIKDLLNNDIYLQQAQAFSRQYQNMDSEENTRQIVERCLQIINSHAQLDK